MTNTTLNVPDISCGHCKSSIEGAVGELDGIDSVEVSIEGKTVAVTYGDDVSLETIVETIEEQGYDVASS
jgi:copper ion binding protein